MKEREVLKKLGFKDEASLQAVDQLKNYELNCVDDHFDLVERNKTAVQNSLNRLSDTQQFMPIFYYSVYGRVIISGWRALLNINANSSNKNEPKSKSDLRHNQSWISAKSDENNVSSIDRLMLGKKATVLIDEKEQEAGLSRLKIDRGHILGKFSNLLSQIEQFLGDEQNVNNVDIYPQFKRANENAKNDHGQLYFEHLIGKHKDTPIYYEAEAIFANFDDKVPIGTRIKIVKIEKENDKYMVAPDEDAISFHVFIPNCDYAEEDPKSVLKPENTVDDYRAFFKGGDLNSLKWK